MSFYNLDNNQANKLNSKIKIKYLYNGNPNKEEFLKSLHNHKIFNTLKEGITAGQILLKKRFKVIEYIKNCNSNYIVSTRCEFSTLLSKYGNNNTVKIASTGIVMVYNFITRKIFIEKKNW